MKLSLLTCLTIGGAAAFPMESIFTSLDARDSDYKPVKAKQGCTTSRLCEKKVPISDEEIDYDPKNPTAAQKASAARTNCGLQGACIGFDAKRQYVSNQGMHKFISPKKSDIRGPCPGLNAAANHGYLPRNGIAHVLDTIGGLGEAYGMAPDLSGFLAAYAIAIDGDILTTSWSIGGPTPKTILGDLSGKAPPQGMSYAHNKYEGDSSITRCDAYINGGDAHSLSTQKFAYAYESGLDNDRYTLDKFSRAFTKNALRSEKTNPLYFAPLFSTTLVSPAAYNFVINLMSNHTEQEHSGYLDGNMFKKFFSVEGEYPNFKWKPGQERIPDNWYRRPLIQGYDAAVGVFGDLASEFAAYPKSFRFGGNVNGVNSYTGIDISNFTNGAYHAKDLLKPQALRCFAYQEIQQGLPDALRGGFNELAQASKFLSKFLKIAFNPTDCPQVSKFKSNNLNAAGRYYNPQGEAENC